MKKIIFGSVIAAILFSGCSLKYGSLSVETDEFSGEKIIEQPYGRSFSGDYLMSYAWYAKQNGVHVHVKTWYSTNFNEIIYKINGKLKNFDSKNMLPKATFIDVGYTQYEKDYIIPLKDFKEICNSNDYMIRLSGNTYVNLESSDFQYEHKNEFCDKLKEEGAFKNIK